MSCTSSESVYAIYRKKEIAAYPFLNEFSWTFQCIHADCPKKFTFTQDLYDHIRLDHIQLICSNPTCNKKFKIMSNLVHHCRSHTKDKPYICPLPHCDYKTTTKGNLKQHLLGKMHQHMMTLKLLNLILSIDTNDPRPTKRLHHPRESSKPLYKPQNRDHVTKKRRYSQPHNMSQFLHSNQNNAPIRKRRRLSMAALSIDTTNSMSYHVHNQPKPTISVNSANAKAQSFTFTPALNSYPQQMPQMNLTHPYSTKPFYGQSPSTSIAALLYGNTNSLTAQNQNQQSENRERSNSATTDDEAVLFLAPTNDGNQHYDTYPPPVPLIPLQFGEDNNINEYQHLNNLMNARTSYSSSDTAKSNLIDDNTQLQSKNPGMQQMTSMNYNQGPIGYMNDNEIQTQSRQVYI